MDSVNLGAREDDRFTTIITVIVNIRNDIHRLDAIPHVVSLPPLPDVAIPDAISAGFTILS